jgi:hypothetical protein
MTVNFLPFKRSDPTIGKKKLQNETRIESTVSKTVDKLVLDDDGHSVNSVKLISGLDSGNSQGMCANCSLL